VDRLILGRLRKEARTSNAAIGGDLDLSEGAVRHRIAQMVAQGIVLRFTVITRPLGPEGLVLLRCRPGATRQVVERMRREVDDLFETSGEFDLGASVEAPTMEEFNQVLDRLRAIPGVESTTTLVRLTRFVGDPIPPGGRPGPNGRARGTGKATRRPPRSRRSDGSPPTERSPRRPGRTPARA
jgi:DNA-binding Lrp family transcriptional regulator